MSDDLKKLMGKLKKEKKEKAEIPTQDAGEDGEVDPETPTEESAEETPKENVTPLQDLEQVDQVDQEIDGEVAVLQNDGIFRRELLLTLRELVDVHKVNTQTLLDLKELLEGADGKKKK